MKEQVFNYIQDNPGCTSSGVNKAVRDDKHVTDWIATRVEIDQLIAAGRVEERIYRGISTFYACLE